MKKIYHILIILPLLCGCIGTELDDISAELDSITDSEIASLSEQIDYVNSTLGDLENLKEEIEASIDKLGEDKVELEKQSDELNAKLEALKSEVMAQSESDCSEVTGQLQTVQSAIEAKINDIDSAIVLLKEKDASLEKKISDLKTYSDGTFANSTWAEGTFATIESQNGLIDDISTVKALIEQLKSSISSVEEEIKALISGSIETAGTDLDAQLAGKVTELTEGYTALIEKAKDDLNEQFGKDLDSAIEKCESKIMTWVNNRLNDYYKVAQAEAQIMAMYATLGNVPDGKNLQAEIDELAEELQQAKTEITDNYSEMITSAIQASEGKMTAEMNEKITVLRTEVIAPLTERVETLESEVEKLTSKLESLVERVNTLDEQIEAINRSLAVLGELDVTLKEYVEGVQQELRDADRKNKKELQDMVDRLEDLLEGSGSGSILSQINALKDFIGTIPDGETSVTTWVEKTRDAINEQFKLYATIEYVDSIKTCIGVLLDGQDSVINAIDNKLSTIIEDNKDLICSWIDTQLADYWTTDSLKTRLDTLRATLSSLIESGDDILSTQIDELKQDIKDAEASLKTQYEDMVTTAISTNNGIITQNIQDAFDAKDESVRKLAERIDAVSSEVKALKTEITQIGLDVDDIRENLDSLQNFIKNSGITSLQAFVDEIKGAIEDCKTKYASLSEFNSFKTTVSSLKTELDKLNGLESRIEATEELSAALKAFILAGFDENDTLADKLAAVNEEIALLWDDVFGKTGETKSLQNMIDDVTTALYGEGGSIESPTDSSLYSILKGMLDKIIVCHFTSAAYIPVNDSRTAEFEKTGSVYKAKFDFEIRPVSLAPLLAKSDACKMVYVQTLTRAFDLKEFDNVTFSATDAGVLTATVTVDNLDFLPTGTGSAALFVDLATPDDPNAVNFTSAFISFTTL